MKKFFKPITSGLISFCVCFLIFGLIIIYPFFSHSSEEKTALKNQPSIVYKAPQNYKTISIKIDIEECPVAFLLKILPKNQNLSITCKSKSANGNIEVFKADEYSKQINFSLYGFENTVNFLGGVEIETPYGLPSPAKNDIIIAKDERLFVYGASLGALLCEEKIPTAERASYYCYVLGELCLKFLKEGSTQCYKFLNNNAETDISYTDYYDNYTSLKETIKYANITSSE